MTSNRWADLRRLGATRALREQRILIVDDDELVLSSLKHAIMVEIEGTDVLTAPSGEVAIELLVREPVNLIITDQRMRGMTGLEFLLAAKKVCPQTPSILITGGPCPRLSLQMIGHIGLYGMLTKPIVPESLIVAIAGILHLHRSHLGRHEATAAVLRGLRDDFFGTTS